MYGHGSGFLVSGSGLKPIIQPTQLVFTEANDPLTDRIRMFFMNMNNMTMTKEALFGCPEKRKGVQHHVTIKNILQILPHADTDPSKGRTCSVQT